MTRNVLGLEALQRSAGAKTRTVELDVPAWGGTVLLREFTGRERLELASTAVELRSVFAGGGAAMTGGKLAEAVEFAARVVQLAWVDSQGEQVVTTAEADKLLDVAYPVLFDIASAALEHSKMGKPGPLIAAEKKS